MADEQKTQTAPEYEYVESPDAANIEYEYVEVPEGEVPPAADGTEEQYEYEYVEAPADAAAQPADGTEEQYEYVEVPESEAQPAADGEQYEYEYVEAPADAAAQPADGTEEQYEYVEVPEGEAQPAADGEQYEYEYVEAPAPEAEEQYEYVEVPEGEAAQYEYTEVPEGEAQPAGEEHYEYEYVEAPAEQTEQKAEEYSIDDLLEEEDSAPANEPPLPPETEDSAPELPQWESETETDATEAPVPEITAEAPVPEIAETETAVSTPLETIPELPAEEASEEDLETVSADFTPEPVAASAENDPTVSDLESLEEAPAPEPEPAPVEDVPETPVENTAEIDALAAEEIAAEAAPAEPEIAEEAQEAEQPSDDEDSLPATGAVPFDGRAGVTTFVGSAVQNAVVLTNDDGSFNRLADWHLVIGDVSVSQLSGQAGQTVALNEDAYNSGILITADGEQHLFANVGEIVIPAVDPDECTLILNSSVVMSLAGHEGSVIALDGANGMLVGPNESKLYFSGLASLTVPAANEQAATASPVSAPVSSNAPVSFVVGRESDPTAAGFVFTAESGVVATDEAVILVKTGYSLYGWNVVFNSGLTMSLADVRTYQTKHDALPESDGQITYKAARLDFTGATKIKVFEKPSYCGYGKAPE